MKTKAYKEAKGVNTYENHYTLPSLLQEFEFEEVCICINVYFVSFCINMPGFSQ